MSRKYFIVVLGLAVICVLLILTSMSIGDSKASVGTQQELKAPVSPYKTYIAATGIVEAGSENILIGTPLSRIIDKIPVKVGMKVKKDDILIELDSRDLAADLAIREAAYQSALAKVQKLENLPRPEDLDAAEAALKSAEVNLELAKRQYEIVVNLPDRRALSREEVNRRSFNYQLAKSKLQEANANFAKVQAGASQHDIEIARLGSIQAKAEVDKIKAEIDRTIIRSPIKGEVLQIRVHPGEMPPQDGSRSPMMIIGDTSEMLLRVSINQFDASFFNPKGKAVAFLRGDSKRQFLLEFVRVDPYLVNKQNFTNEITEKVDTKVLQVIYKFKGNAPGIYVGQQMDVFIETGLQ